MSSYHAQDFHPPRFPIYLYFSNAAAVGISSGKLTSRISYPFSFAVYLRPAVASAHDSDVIGQSIYHHSTNRHALLRVAFEVDTPLTNFQILRAGIQHLSCHFKKLPFSIGRCFFNRSPGEKGGRLRISPLIQGANLGVCRDQLYLVQRESQLLGRNLNYHALIPLAIIYYPGDNGRIAIFVKLYKCRGASPNPHGKTTHNRTTGHPNTSPRR